MGCVVFLTASVAAAEVKASSIAVAKRHFRNFRNVMAIVIESCDVLLMY